ncbi:hypothetical protein [Colwellia hornerae]|uniref:Uncharacterized protein n=1 Tax=Colwellia hornerae TaxID=89402 RepID=A0A5C6QKD0_9GAMM|nr:hypothetical protein [Colwellia hornerae]TWX58631.1 hypothetical protein ESZ28_02375 [Colwellia hornerae]TWX59697.1 hypothetical protein ESZ26_09690 [Colwellia hornerae]TWX69424.1 hypothetical protein ESZ27_05690 [Colwellia hornerae]
MNKLSKGLTFSIILHIILLVIFTQPFSPSQLKTVEKHASVKPIQARLYFPSQQKEQVTLVPKKGSLAIVEDLPVAEKLVSNKLAKKIPPTKIQPAKPSKQPNDKNALTRKILGKKIGKTSLDKLRQRLHKQIIENAANDNLNKFLTDKRTIDRSITKYNQLALATAKIKEVDCNNSTFNSAVKAMSSLLGGSIKCNSIPNLKGFLNKSTGQAEKKTQKNQ